MATGEESAILFFFSCSILYTDGLAWLTSNGFRALAGRVSRRQFSTPCSSHISLHHKLHPNSPSATGAPIANRKPKILLFHPSHSFHFRPSHLRLSPRSHSGLARTIPFPFHFHESWFPNHVPPITSYGFLFPPSCSFGTGARFSSMRHVL